MNIIVVAAPFGFGPASKALLIARALSSWAKVTIFSNGDAFRFIERFKGESVSCREGVFHSSFANDAQLACFDAFVSVDNEPAARHLVARGLGSRTVFVDDILPWRTLNGTPGFGGRILGYLVQDFPGAADGLQGCDATRVELVAPMVWTSAQDIASQVPGRPMVSLHLGGVTSPLVGWAMVRQSIREIFVRCREVARHHDHRLVVFGSRHLCEFADENDDDVEVLGDVSPSATAAYVAGSKVLLSTPGIGAVYEAIAAGVPTVLLPPMNSTQLHQYGIFSDRGFTGSMQASASERLFAVASRFPWDKQTACCIEWLRRNLDSALAQLPVNAGRLLATDKGRSAVEDALRCQSAFQSGLSHTNALGVLAQLLDGIGRPSPAQSPN